MIFPSSEMKPNPDTLYYASRCGLWVGEFCTFCQGWEHLVYSSLCSSLSDKFSAMPFPWLEIICLHTIQLALLYCSKLTLLITRTDWKQWFLSFWRATGLGHIKEGLLTHVREKQSLQIDEISMMVLQSTSYYFRLMNMSNMLHLSHLLMKKEIIVIQYYLICIHSVKAGYWCDFLFFIHKFYLQKK